MVQLEESKEKAKDQNKVIRAEAERREKSLAMFDITQTKCRNMSHEKVSLANLNSGNC